MQGTHCRSVLGVAATISAVPGTQAVCGAHSANPTLLLKVPFGQEMHSPLGEFQVDGVDEKVPGLHASHTTSPSSRRKLP